MTQLPPQASAADAAMPAEGIQFRATGGGHGTGFFTDAVGSTIVLAAVVGAEAANWSLHTARDAVRARPGRARAEQMHSSHNTIFPTLAFLGGFHTMRVWHPRGPNAIEVWAFTTVDRDRPDAVKNRYRTRVLSMFF